MLSLAWHQGLLHPILLPWLLDQTLLFPWVAPFFPQFLQNSFVLVFLWVLQLLFLVVLFLEEHLIFWGKCLPLNSFFWLLELQIWDQQILQIQSCLCERVFQLYQILKVSLLLLYEYNVLYFQHTPQYIQQLATRLPFKVLSFFRSRVFQ